MKKYRVLGGALLVAASISGGGQADNLQYYVGGSVAASLLDSDRHLTNDSLDSVGGGLQFGFSEEDGVGLELGATSEFGGDDLATLSLSVIKRFEQGKSWHPYVLTGLTYFDLDSDEVFRDQTLQPHIGVGVANRLNETIEIRGDVRGFYYPGEDYFDSGFTLGVNYLFGKPAQAVEVEPEPEPAVVAEKAPEPKIRTITVQLNVRFEFDKAVVRKIYGDELMAVAAAMRNHDDIELLLEGHTDYIGTDQYNQGLSERRAAAVKARLIEDYGIDPDRISTIGYGETRPIADNSTDEGRAINRRVVGELHYEEVEAPR